MYRNAVAYNTPGKGKEGSTCATCCLRLSCCAARTLRSGTLDAMHARPAAPGALDATHARCASRPPGLLPAWAAWHWNPPLPTRLNTLACPSAHTSLPSLPAGFIDTAKRMLDESERLIAQHMHEIQAAEVRPGSGLRALRCCAWGVHGGWVARRAATRRGRRGSWAWAASIKAAAPCPQLPTGPVAAAAAARHFCRLPTAAGLPAAVSEACGSWPRLLSLEINGAMRELSEFFNYMSISCLVKRT